MEQNGSLSFRDIKINHGNNKFTTSLYPKLIFSRAFTNFESFIYKYYKGNLTDTLLHRGFGLSFNMEKFHHEINSLKLVFKSNAYPKNYINSRVKYFLDNLLVKYKLSLTVPKLQLVCVLSYTRKSSLDLNAHLRHTIEKI